MAYRPVTLLLAAGVAVATSMVSALGADPVDRVRYDDHRIVRVRVESAAALSRVTETGAEPWPCRFGPGPVDFRVDPDAIARLDAAGIPYVTVVEDLQARVEAERNRLEAAGEPDADWFDDFRRYDEVNARLDVLVTMRPDLVTKLALGETHEERTVYGLRITGPGADKPAVLFNGCQHAREWLAVMVPMFIADAIVTRYDTDPRIRALVDAVEVYVVPIVNPDGYVHSWEQNRYWRKNRRITSDPACRGVDLNRNWPVDWGGPHSTSFDPCSPVFFGSSAFSEPESRLVRDFIEARPQLACHIDFHSYSQVILQPWGHTFATPPRIDEIDALGDAMSEAMRAVNGRSWPNGPAGELLYLASGVFPDWALCERNMLSYTFELTGTDFVVSPTEILPTGEESLHAALAMMEWAATPLRLRFLEPAPERVDDQTVLRMALSDPGAIAVPDTAQVWLDTGDGFASAPLVANADGELLASFPAARCRTEVQYYFTVETTAGDLIRQPFVAPDDVYTAIAFDRIDVAFEDAFETDLGWTVIDSVPLGRGAWERGVPEPNATQGAPGADADGTGQCYVTGLSIGHDVDFGSTTLVSPRMDASNPDASLQYQRWYSNVAGDNPEMDVLTVEISDDDGTTWHALEVVGPSGPEVRGGWIERTFRIAGLAQVENTSSLRVRFTASDPISTGGSTVEAGVDGVRVVALRCGCPADFDDSGAVGFGDLLALFTCWGPCASPACPCDVDEDGDVGFGDLQRLLNAWGTCAETP